MANLNRIHFERFEPNIGDNLELVTDRLSLQLAVGMTKEELKGFSRAVVDALDVPEKEALTAVFAELRALPPETTTDSELFISISSRLDAAAAARDSAAMRKLAVAWDPFVKFGPGAHSLDGKPCASLVDYLEFVFAQAGRFNFLEVQEEVKRLNSIEGTRALFSASPLGGSTSTQLASGARDRSQTAGR